MSIKADPKKSGEEKYRLIKAAELYETELHDNSAVLRQCHLFSGVEYRKESTATEQDLFAGEDLTAKCPTEDCFLPLILNLATYNYTLGCGLEDGGLILCH